MRDARSEPSEPNRFERKRLLRLLSRGPWCWPRYDSQGWQVDAEGRLGIPRPEMKVGGALLVAVKETDASLWALLPAATIESDTQTTPLGDEAQRAWEVAAMALPRSLPVLWRSAREAADQRMRAVNIVRTPKIGHQAMDDRVIDGSSFGLAMALSMASMVLDSPLPDDLVASARIDEHGNVHRVDALEDKLWIVETHAHCVTRMLVPTKQVAELSGDHSGRVEVIGVGSVGEAVELAFPDIAHRLRELGSDPARRSDVLQSMLRLAIGDRSAAVRWRPIARAADEALCYWEPLSEHERFTLELVRGVAERHDSNSGAIGVPSSAWLERLPLPLQVRVVAHLTQQSADTGEPSANAVSDLGERYLVSTKDAFDEHLSFSELADDCWR